MTYTNDAVPQVDVPVWEWCRFAPTASSSLSGWCSGEINGSRYIYYLVGTGFWRFDTVTEAWQPLQAPHIPALSVLSMRFTSHGGFRGNCLGCSSNTTMTIAGFNSGRFNGYKIRITEGLGKGQPDRTITNTGSVIINDYGVATAASASLLTDSTKKWAINQFIGQQCRIVFNTGLTQVRKILYNNTNTLYFQDNNYQQLECWNNTAFTTAPVVTAGSQAHFTIETVEITIDSPWTVTPDASSSFMIMSGGIWMATSFATTPWMQLLYYDIATDTWTTKTSPGGLLTAAFGTDITIERTGEIGGAFDAGTATSGTEMSLVDTSKSWEINRWRGYQVRITGGVGVSNTWREITGNIGSTLFVNRPFETTPDATSTYTIFGNIDNIYLAGNNSPTLFKYSVSANNWKQGPMVDFGIACSMVSAYNGQQPFGVTSMTRATPGITALNPVPTAGGTGYSVGTILSITGVTNGQAIVTSESGGVVTGVALFRAGSAGATVASGLATTAAAGTGCTLAVTAIGVIGRVTTITNHNLCTGDAVVIKGAVEAAWNNSYTVLATDSLTTFDITTTATATAVASATQSTTVLVDASKSWGVNELQGCILQINTAGPAPTTQIRKITSNTATTVTVPTITAAVDGTSRYIIYQPWNYGREEQYKVAYLSNMGYATGGSTTTLVDTTKKWNFGQWVGYKFKVISGTGYGTGEITITSHTATTLTFATQTFTPDSTTQYIIFDTFGLATSFSTTTIGDTTKVWGVNQFAGKRVRITGGTGQSQEGLIVSNTATVLTLTAALTTAPDATSTYCILSTPPKAAGIELNWIYGNASTDTKGKFIILPRGGGSNIIDRYNINSDTFEVIHPITPQAEVFTTGSMWAYTGKDHLICHSYLAGVFKIVTIDVSTGEVNGGGNPPIVNGAACLGNRMEVITTKDGVKYLYAMRHTGQEICKTVLWWLDKNLTVSL